MNIRDKRVQEMARELAERRGVTMTQVMREALEKEIAQLPLRDRIMAIGRRCSAAAGDNGRTMSKEEIDDMWTR